MSPEGFKSFQPTNIELGARKVEQNEIVTSEELPEVFKGFTPEEMRNFDSRILGRVPWATDLKHPVYENLPDDVIELMKQVTQQSPNKEAEKQLLAVLEARWEEWDEKQG